jgi:hypothetical protein
LNFGQKQMSGNATVPPEYKKLGSLPADQFVPALMQRRHTEYYAGLLTAAQCHGAAHHRPQVFQVMLDKNERPIRCGAVHVSVIARKRLREVPVDAFNTPRGAVRLPESQKRAVEKVAGVLFPNDPEFSAATENGEVN